MPSSVDRRSRGWAEPSAPSARDLGPGLVPPGPSTLAAAPAASQARTWGQRFTPPRASYAGEESPDDRNPDRPGGDSVVWASSPGVVQSTVGSQIPAWSGAKADLCALGLLTVLLAALALLAALRQSRPGLNYRASRPGPPSPSWYRDYGASGRGVAPPQRLLARGTRCAPATGSSRATRKRCTPTRAESDDAPRRSSDPHCCDRARIGSSSGTRRSWLDSIPAVQALRRGRRSQRLTGMLQSWWRSRHRWQRTGSTWP